MSEPFDGRFEDHQIAQLRVPPHSIEAESSVLGALMLDNGAWDRVGDLLVEADFYRSEHKLIFAAIAALINACKPADVITVFTQLQNAQKADEVGGLGYLNELAQYVPSASNIRRYAEIIRERALSRKLIKIGDEISVLGFTAHQPFEERRDEASGLLMTLMDGVTGDDDWQSTDEGAVQALDRITELAEGTGPVDYIPFGLKDLDEALDGGGREGELIVIGARPGMGKSALALTIGMHVALEEGKAVGLFSMEMPKRQVTNRQISVLSHIHLSKLKLPERLKEYDWTSLTEAIEKLRRCSFFTSDKTGLNINQMRSRARGLKRRHGLRLLIVDYLGLMSGTDSKQPRAYQLEEATKGLKNLAKELGITVLLLAQINREAEKRVDQMPILSDLRDSGAVEQDADIVMFIHRPIKAKPDLGPDWEHYAKVFIAKQRDGGTAYLNLGYVGSNTRFFNWTSDVPGTTGVAKPKKNL